MILKRQSKEMEKILLSRGVSAADLLHGRDEFDVASGLVKYETEIPRVMPKIISSAKQFRAIEKIMAHPMTQAPYVLGISSFPSDMRAKHLAIAVMANAISQWQKKHRPGYAMPLWHKVYGGYQDTLRDRHSDEKPSLLIISNVVDGAGNVKIEKTRDLLEMYSHIPRIVVMGGQDPLTFFGTKLYYPINAGLYLGPKNKIEEK